MQKKMVETEFMMNLLIVDDKNSHIDIVSSFLDDIEEVDLNIATSGKEALIKATKINLI